MKKLTRFYLAAALAAIFALLASSTNAAGAAPVIVGIDMVSWDRGHASANGISNSASISADGGLVAFASTASDLIFGDGNNVGDIFVRDMASGVTERVSITSTGAEANNTSSEPSISADGRFVAFTSLANNLTTGSYNSFSDVYVRDRQLGTTTLVSAKLDHPLDEANNRSSAPAISADGRYVAFLSSATDIYPETTVIRQDVYVRDLQTWAIVRASVNDAGVRAETNSNPATNPPFAPPAISADGRYVAFFSAATNLVAGDTNGSLDIFVRDLQGDTTIRASVDSSGIQVSGNSIFPSLTSDGRYVAFLSDSSTLVSGDTNGIHDVFVKDLQSGSVTRVSVSSTGEQQNLDNVTWAPSISSAGRFVVFDSLATNLVSGDTNGVGDVFVHDLQTGQTRRLSHDSAGVQGNNTSTRPAVSADGHYMVFQSNATNLVYGDSNGNSDIFIAPLIWYNYIPLVLR